MPWTLTRNIDEFLAAAEDHLQAEPVLHTVPLTVLDSLRKRGPAAYGDDAPVYGWHESAGRQIDGAFLQTPPFPLLVATLPSGSVADLIARLSSEAGLPAVVNLPAAAEADFGAAWARAARGSTTASQRSRLYRLDRLVRPDPAPPGVARVAGRGDRELLIDWHVAFGQEAGTVAEIAARTVDDRLSHDGLTVWETGGLPVAMAGSTREVAGVVRIAPVYTIPAHRQRGYGGAVTAAASQAALDAGASAVVLFTVPQPDQQRPIPETRLPPGSRPCGASARARRRLGCGLRRALTSPAPMSLNPSVTAQAPTPS